MWNRVISLGLAALLAAFAGCATGGGAGATRDGEMKEGYRAARHGYWQEALMRFERAAELAPRDAAVLNNLAVALEAVGRYEEAGERYAQAAGLDPSDSKLKRNKRQYEDFFSTYIEDTADEGQGEHNE